MTSIFDKASASYPFYVNLFRKLEMNDILNRGGKAKLLKDMTTLEYQDYVDMVVREVTDNHKD